MKKNFRRLEFRFFFASFTFLLLLSPRLKLTDFALLSPSHCACGGLAGQNKASRWPRESNNISNSSIKQIFEILLLFPLECASLLLSCALLCDDHLCVGFTPFMNEQSQQQQHTKSGEMVEKRSSTNSTTSNSFCLLYFLLSTFHRSRISWDSHSQLPKYFLYSNSFPTSANVCCPIFLHNFCDHIPLRPSTTLESKMCRRRRFKDASSRTV